MSLRHIFASSATIVAVMVGSVSFSSSRSEERSILRVEGAPQEEVIVTGRRQTLPGLREIQDFNAAELAALRRRYVTPVRKPRSFEADIPGSRLSEHAFLVEMIAGSTPLRDVFSANPPR